jgi:hypothetical protein
MEPLKEPYEVVKKTPFATLTALVGNCQLRQGWLWSIKSCRCLCQSQPNLGFASHSWKELACEVLGLIVDNVCVNSMVVCPRAPWCTPKYPPGPATCRAITMIRCKWSVSWRLLRYFSVCERLSTNHRASKRKKLQARKNNCLLSIWNSMRMNAKVPPSLTWPTFVGLFLIFLALLCLLIL